MLPCMLLPLTRKASWDRMVLQTWQPSLSTQTADFPSTWPLAASSRGTLPRLLLADIHQVPNGSAAGTSDVNNLHLLKPESGKPLNHSAVLVLNFNYDMVRFTPSINQQLSTLKIANGKT